ncbi:Lrp/AsnC family transcriptional regulator [Streptomyces sp. SID10815]|uniref:Lrp/AsnC family transcriptional regulator n=1 Tax=Streptomyces sp. SID10815 TaxID=2706027 RepID=UPI0031BAFD17
MTRSVTLDTLDRRLVHALQIDGRAPFSRIAAVLGVPERTVARRYHRLRSALVVRVVGLVDSARVGMLDWFVRVECAPDAVDALTAALAQRDDTSWLAPLAGGGRLVCMVRTPAVGADGGRLLFDHLARTPGVRDLAASCVLRPVAGVGGWAGRTSALDATEQARLRSWAAADGEADGADGVDGADGAEGAEGGGGGADRTDGVGIGSGVGGADGDDGGGGFFGAKGIGGGDGAGGAFEWSEGDVRLVGELARDGRAEVRELSAVTGWSASTVRRRIARLRAAGVLHFEVDVDPALFGSPVEALLWLEVAPSALGRVTGALARQRPVAFAAVTTGSASVFAMVQCSGTGALYDYLAHELGGLPGIGRTETALVQRRAKRAGALLLPEPPSRRLRRP